MDVVQRPRTGKNEVEEDEIDGDLLVCLLERFRYGKMYNPSREIGSVTTTTSKDVEDDDHHKSHVGAMSVHESMSSVSSDSDTQIQKTEDQTESIEQNNDLLSADSRNLPVVEQLTTEGSEIEIEEEKNTSTETTEEPDLESLLANQERYDLFCPNCDSCITKRVILKKRKRGQHGSAAEQRNEPEKPNEIDEVEPPVKVPAVCSNSDEEEEEEEEPHVFSCLSCLRFFIQLGKASETVKPQIVGFVRLLNLNRGWSGISGTRFMLLNLFKDGREPVQQRVDDHDQPITESSKTPPSDSSPNPPTETEGLVNPSSGAGAEHRRDLTAGEGSSKDNDDRSNLESENIPPLDLNPKPEERLRDGAQDSSSVMQKPSKPLGTIWWWRLSDINMDHILGYSKLTSKPLEVFWWRKPSNSIDKVQDKDTLQVTIQTRTRTSDTTTRPQEDKENQEGGGSEILKSLVYGGLTEAITSLGVVSSAAGSGASTLNILALAIANLVSGLIVLAHNLRDLRNEDVDLVTTHSEEQQKDRYNELLGRRANFRLHVLVAVLSYIISGLIPPLVYTFSYHQTGIRNYTIVSVFSVSLVCIGLLSMIKAYVREPPRSYIKSVTYYVGIAVTSSGISYIVGDIVGGFIENLGWFEANQTGMTSVLEEFKPVEVDLASF